MKAIAILLLALVAGCAASSQDDTSWHYVYRLQDVGQGCTVARSLDPAIVKLEWPAPVSDGLGGYVGWYHPCQDGTDRLCPDLSAPGMFADVYAKGDIDPTSFVVIEACQ